MRRSVATFPLLALLTALQFTPASAQTFTRESLQTFTADQAKLISLIRGVFVMKQRNSAPRDSADYRRSWEYWAAIHGYPGVTAPTGTLQQVQQRLVERFPEDAPLFAGFFTGLQDVAPPDQPPGLAAKVWATCEHNTPQFLAWHRMYLFFFERVLREASGDPGLALPYWDYTNVTEDAAVPSSAPYRVPSIFAVEELQTTTGTLPNPLFEKRRTAGFASSVHLDPAATDVDSTLALAGFSEFQSALDGGLHGFIHCAVGNGCLAPYIGLVPFSANDPLFWHHHANVDRLWDCWSTVHGRDQNPLTDTAWMNAEHTFVDETGAEVTMKVSELFDPSGRIDYKYDQVANCTRAPASPRALAMAPEAIAAPVREEVARAANIGVTQVDQSVSLSSPTERAAREMVLASRPNVIQPTRAKLTLETVRVEREPGASVRVYLTDAEGSRREFVGLLSFFAAFDHAGHGGADEGRSYAFDVSRQLQALAAQGADTSRVKVAFAAARGLSGDAAPALNAERYRSAGLTIGKIALSVEKQPATLNLE